MDAAVVPRVLVSIVNYNSGDLTLRCVESLEGEVRELPGTRVVVVDNDSSDGSGAALERTIQERGWSGWAETLHAARNGGYAFGNNLAIRRDLESGAPADYVLLLNPDTVVQRGAIRALIDFLEASPGVGIAGSRNEDPDGTAHVSCFRFGSVWNELASNLKLGLVDRLLASVISRVPIPAAAQPIDWVAGSAMMIRGKVLREIGLLDEGYFLYFEESDFCLRARRAGWACWYVPRSRVMHLVGFSTGVTRRGSRRPRRPSYWYESRRRYFLKNHGALYALAADGAAILGQALWQLRRAILRKQDSDSPHILADLIRHSVFLKGTRIDDGQQAMAVPGAQERGQELGTR